MPIAALRALLAPLDPATFFDRYYEREALHIRALAEAARPLLTHEELFAALAARALPPAGLMVFPEHFDAAVSASALLADPECLRAYVDAGHPLVWNRARGVSPAVDALTAALSAVFGAHVWPNVYATGEAGTPFDMHFDCHEVLAVHCEGEKTWQISACRIDRPLDAAEMEPAVRAALAGRRDEASARPLLDVAVGPGDVVYIPRGQFHNARTTRGRSLHVTFGIRALSGFDVVKILAGSALAEPLFREYLPAAAADPDGVRTAELVHEILTRIQDLAGSEDLVAAVGAARTQLIRRGETR